MMQLPCPWCGVRDEPEFLCGGTTAIARPPLEASDQEWGQYLFFRDNPKGVHFSTARARNAVIADMMCFSEAGRALPYDFGNLTHMGVSTFNSVAFADAVSV